VFWTLGITIAFVLPLSFMKTGKHLETIATLCSSFLILLVAHAIYWFFNGLYSNGFDPHHKTKLFAYGGVWISALGVNSMSYGCSSNLFPILEHLKDCTVKRGKSAVFLTYLFSFLIYNIFGLVSYFYLFDRIQGGSVLEDYDISYVFTKITVIGLIIMLTIHVPIVLIGVRNSVNLFFSAIVKARKNIISLD
jgi:amino acid permease